MRAKKSLGQNFLIDQTVIDRIVNALRLDPSDEVVEIGPGEGALTSQLVGSDASVTVIELDRDLVQPLTDRFGSHANFQILRDDVLQVDFSLLIRSPPAKLVANLPYYISTPILQKLIDARPLFSTIVLMFQREVAERITAQPGNRERGYLSVLAQNAFEIRRLCDVPPMAFRPAPKVWSSVIELKPLPMSIPDSSEFKELISRAFSQKRKTILNNLRPFYPHIGDIFRDIGIDPQRRSETIELEEWKKLAAALNG